MAFANNPYRIKMLVAFVLIIVLGILSRVLPTGFRLWDKYLGDVLYAAVFYAAISLVWTDWTRTTKLVVTTIYVVAIEFFQLTPFPEQLKHSSQLAIKLFAVIILGSTFSWWDLLAYGVGIAAMLGVDRWLRRA